MQDVYRRYGVPYQATDARGGWISAHCPFCAGSAEYHLGFSVSHSYFKCWRCGRHDAIDALVTLCHVDRAAALDIYRSVRGGAAEFAKGRDRKAQARVGISLYRHPGDVGAMRANHRRYLEGRGFDPDLIEREWGVLGTGPMSSLDEIDYRHRLLIPVRWDGAEVSFQARDVTGKSDRKYLACPDGREVRSHKHVLYGRQECWGEVGIVVEGATDAWRLGPRACAVFGIQYRPEQVLEIARHFRRVAVVFDAERAAQAQARRLAAQLRLRLDVEPVVVYLGDGIDPGSMSQDDADHLVRELTR
jgi:hypothetical protein